MIADRVRMRKVKNREVGVGIEVTIHTLNFEYVYIYVGDGTLNQYGEPTYVSADNLVYTTNGDETITLIVEEGSYISVSFKSTHRVPFDFYYTSLDSTIRNLRFPILGGNIHITENIEIYYNSRDAD